MKRIAIIGLLLSWISLQAWSQSAHQAAPGEVQLHITGFKNDRGQAGILLFDQAEGFPSDRGQATAEILLPIEDGEVRHVFTDLLPGTYAVSVMHDENKNNQLDMNILGIPTEGNAVSNNVTPRFRAPRFGEAAFSLGRRRHALEIKMRY